MERPNKFVNEPPEAARDLGMKLGEEFQTQGIRLGVLVLKAADV
ncbi:MAG: hypothetical protein AAF639_04280 [Chloroflexota bacterium]